MTQLVNQFELSKEKGQLDLQLGQSVLSCRVDASQTTLAVGAAVKLFDVAGGVPNVVACADTDLVFGFVCKNLKKEAYVANDAIEVAVSGTFMYMTAGAAIVPQAEVMYVAATGKVITAAGTSKAIAGIALDKAAADADLIRVLISVSAAKRPAA